MTLATTTLLVRAAKAYSFRFLPSRHWSTGPHTPHQRQSAAHAIRKARRSIFGVQGIPLDTLPTRYHFRPLRKGH